MNTEKFSRPEFYNLVWSQSFFTICQKYKIAYDGIRAICREYEIPFPQTGYWALKSHKRMALIVELPKDYNGKDEIILTLREQDIAVSKTTGTPRKALLEAIKKDKSLPLIVSNRLTNPDKLIVTAKTILADNQRNFSRYYQQVSSSNYGLDIRVSKAMVDRSLRLFDSFIKLLRNRNHDIIIEYGDTKVVIQDEKIRISLKEKLVRDKSGETWKTGGYLPTGILIFRLEGYYERMWSDGKKPLEEQMADILSVFELEGQRKREERLRSEENERIRAEKRRIEREEWERQEKEKANFNDLLQKANQWQQAMILRNYIVAIEEKASKDGELTDELNKWLSWAKDKVESFDPLCTAKMG